MPRRPILQSGRVRVETGPEAPLPASAHAFETRWAEEQWVREVMAGVPALSCRSSKVGDEFFISQALSRRDLIHHRLAHGFTFFGGEVGGRRREAFREEGLRSGLAHVLRRIVAMTPRTHRMQVGRGKAVMHSTDSKVLGLDEPWIVLNGEVRGLFRIDLDFTFPSWNALRQELVELPLPCLPHIAIGFELEDGRVERPHLLYMLPPDGVVWFSDDERCRRDIMNLWRGVHAGLTKAHLPLGGDPGALANPMRIKNPLSPFWSVRVWNEEMFPTLSDWSGWVDTSSNREAMIRESASKLAGASRKASNALFTTFQERAYATLAEWQREGDADFTVAILEGDRDRLAEHLFRSLVKQASREAENPKQAQAVLYRVVSYAADRWDPSLCSRNRARDRGACSDRIEGIDCVRNRQGVGARYAAERRRARTHETIRRTIAEIEAAGEPVTKLGVSRRSGLSRPTVIANWPGA